MSKQKLTAGVVLAAAAVLTLSACAGSTADRPAAAVSTPGASGSHHPASGRVPLHPPFAKPHLVLTDQHGHRYDLYRQTAGKPTLLYFGYTHCPDVCPTTMADIAAAAHTLPAAERHRLRVVFVSTDPARDTPRRLTQWLGAIDPQFIGLTGDFTAVQAAARGVGVGVSKPVRHADGSETVSHGAEVIAFSPHDDKAHLLYTSGVSSQRYAADLPKLIQGETP